MAAGNACLLLLLTFFSFHPSDATDASPLPVASWPADQALSYDYSTKMRLAERLSTSTSGRDEVSVEFGALLSFTRVARLSDEGSLVELSLSEPRLGATKLSGPPPVHPAMLVIRRGAVDMLYVHEKESAFWCNHYKGIASLMTSQASAGEQKEVDASGECFSTYSLGEDGVSVRRSKKRCSLTDLTGEVSSREELQQVRRARVSKTVLVIRQGRLESARSSETVMVTVSATAQAVSVESEQQLKFKAQTSRPAKETAGEDELEAAVARVAPGKSMRAVGLASVDGGSRAASERELRATIEAHRESLRHEQAASLPAVTGFRALLEVARRIRDVRTLARVIADDDLADVTPVLGDVLVACGSGPCLKAALDWVALRNAERAEESERLLLGLSLLSDPDEATLRRLLTTARAMLKPQEGQEGVRAQLWATLGSLTGRFGLSPAGRYAEITGEASAFLLDRLKSSKTEDDSLAALNALANLRSAEPVPACLEVMIKANVSGRLRCAAVRAVEALEVSPEVRGVARGRALRTFQARAFPVDLTGRLCALDLLLHLHPTLSQLVNAGIAARRDTHLRSAFLRTVRRWAIREKRLDTWRNLHRLLPDLWRYPGSPAAPVIEEAAFGPDLHFRMALVAGPDGVVRRSDTAAHLELPSGARFPLYQLAIFTDGLGSVTSGAAEGAEGEDVTAGISLRLLGASLRPVRFFSGYSGLMTAVWNAPSSLTPFLQTNMAFLEASHLILLQSGFSVRFSASGLASVDLSGLVAIGMWTQRADTQLKTQAAVELTARARLVTDRFSMEVGGRAAVVAMMEFNTHVAFSATPPALCLVASRPDTIVEVQKERRAQVGAAKPEVKTRHQTSVLPGATLSLGRANERTCASLVTE